MIVLLVSMPVWAVTTPALALPRPLDEVAVVGGAGLTRDRLLTSRAPGPVANREAVTVAVGADGTPAGVTVEQRLSITGTGDYQIRERGPARGAQGIGDTVPPVLKLGTVVWQGFSPGRRDLAARLTLDAGLEAPRLPLAVNLEFTARNGRRTPLEPGGKLPGPGILTVTLTNSTSRPVTVPVGVAEPRAAAGALQTLLDAAGRPRPGRPPTAGNGLPLTVPGTATGTASLPAVAALRVSGSLRVPAIPARVTGPGTAPLADGARIVGTLHGAVSFRVEVPAAGHLALDLSVQPWLDPRPLAPPAPHRSWPAWAAARPSAVAQRDATSTLLAETANAARAAEYTPYLDAALPGSSATTYRYVLTTSLPAPTAGTGLRPRPAAIAAATVAALLIMVDLGLLWRRL
jgi:hypothetical protein